MLDPTLLGYRKMLAFAQSHSPHLFLVFVSALLIASAAFAVYQCYFSPLASFPGPFATKVTTLWRAYTTSLGQWHLWLAPLPLLCNLFPSDHSVFNLLLYREHAERFILPYIGNFLAANDRNGYLFEFAKSEVQDRRDKGGNDMNIVGQFFQTARSKSELTNLSISFMMTTNFFAGSDTTAIGLRSIFLNLLKHPRVLAKLRAELEERNQQSSSQTQSPFRKPKPAIIYEALRVFSPVGFTPDRDVPKEGMTICGKFVPGGTVVGSSPWVIHHMLEIWGPENEEFKPERWLGEDTSHLKRFFFAFGGGTRTCIGKDISWLEMDKLVSTLLMRYNFKLVDEADITDVCSALVFLKGLKVKITMRET
ncbi:Cytochrome P450 monooxygenase andK [Trichoderma ghanense]|uniref:Cytochrome P450 monooxygenase andK n=1 Tax=Trichoderma ghanense TaxID=65468 RepID=A0ABY2HDV2_9HYPO